MRVVARLNTAGLISEAFRVLCLVSFYTLCKILSGWPSLQPDNLEITSLGYFLNSTLLIKVLV